MITPETLTRHELVGLPVRVADAANPDLVGSSGRVVEETMRTLRVSDGSRTRTVPKRDSTLEFRLDAVDSSGCQRPGERTEDGRGGPSESTDSTGRTGPVDTTHSVGREGPTEETYEAASDREVAGGAFEREEDTAGVRPGQSSSTADGARSARKPADGACEGASYVTVDGTKLLSRPALRTEVAAGDTIWQSD